MIIEPLTQIGLVLRTIALVLLIFKVLPTQYKEYRLHNGLKFYRGVLFGLGIVATISIIVAMVFVINRIYANPLNVNMEIISFTYSTSDLILSLILYLIYNGKGGEN